MDSKGKKKKETGESSISKALSSLKAFSQPNSMMSMPDSLASALKLERNVSSPQEMDLAMKIGGGLIKGIAKKEKKEKTRKKSG